MKSPVIALVVLLLSTTFVAFGVPFGLAKSGTNMSGEISRDTTWTAINSPYNITGNVTVNSGVTLTIQPGVQVISKNNFGDGQGGVFEASLTVDGALVAVGDSNNPIIFNDTQVTFSQLSVGWNPQVNSGSIIKSCFFEDADLRLDSSPKIDSTLFSDSKYSAGVTTGGESSIIIEGGSPIISNNYMTNNSMQDMYGWNGNDDIEIANGNNATIIGNVLADGMDGIGVDAPIANFTFNSFSGTTTIENNLIIGNKGAGIGCGAQFPLIIKDNTITQNYIGIAIGAFSTSSIITSNNIYSNAGIFDNIDRSLSLAPAASSPIVEINASSNWWGTTDTTAISQSINDPENGRSLGTVTLSPF